MAVIFKFSSNFKNIILEHFTYSKQGLYGCKYTSSTTGKNPIILGCPALKSSDSLSTELSYGSYGYSKIKYPTA